jgi:hypothetical protein
MHGHNHCMGQTVSKSVEGILIAFKKSFKK